MNKKLSFLLCCLMFSNLKAEDLEKKARQLFQAEAYSEAIECYQKLMNEHKSGPKRQVVRYNLALAYTANGEYHKAYSLCLSILQDHEKHEDVFYEKVLKHALYSKIGWLKKQLIDLEENPTEAAFQNFLSSIEQTFDELEQYVKEKYPDSKTLNDRPTEITELKNALKDLKSKGQNLHKAFYYESANYLKLYSAIQKDVLNHFSVTQKLLSKADDPHFIRHELKKAYYQAKKMQTSWNALDKVLKQEVEKNSSDQNLSESERQNVEKLQTKYPFFEQAYNFNKAALESQKEQHLENVYRKLHLSHCLLTWMEEVDKGLDLFDKAHEQALKVSSEQQIRSEKGSSILKSAKEDLLSIASNALYQTHEKVLQDLESVTDQDKKEKLNIIASLQKKLVERLSNQKISDQMLQENRLIYEFIKSSPSRALFEAYQKNQDSKAISDTAQQQLKTLSNALKEFSQTHVEHIKEDKRPKWEQCMITLAQLEQAIDQKDHSQTQRALKQLLSFLAPIESMCDLMNQAKEQYQKIQQQPSTFEEKASDLQSLENQLKELNQNRELNSENKNPISELDSTLNEIQTMTKQAQSESLSNEQISLLMENNAQLMQEAKQILENHEATQEELLSRAIEAQKLAQKNTDSFLGDPQTSQTPCPCPQAPERMQNQVMKTATSLDQMMQQNQGPGSSESVDGAQNNEAFQKGLEAAQKAQELLNQGSQDGAQISQLQQKALEEWKKMQNPQNQDSNSGTGSSAQESGEQQGSNEQQESNSQNQEIADANCEEESEVSEEILEASNEEESKETLDRLQQMQYEDDLSPPEKRKPKVGNRPW